MLESLLNMDGGVLLFIQEYIRNPILNAVMLFITNLGKCTQIDARALPDNVYENYLHLLEKEIEIIVKVGDGAYSSKAWGCDLTYDYVKINGDYRS